MRQACSIQDILKCGGSCTLGEFPCCRLTMRMSMQKTQRLTVILQRPRSFQMPKVKVVLQSMLVAVLTTPDLRALALATQKCRVGYVIIARPIYVRRHQGCHRRRLRIGIGEGASILGIKI